VGHLPPTPQPCSRPSFSDPNRYNKGVRKASSQHNLINSPDLNHAAGKNGIFSEHITNAEPKVCFYNISVLFQCVFITWENFTTIHENPYCVNLQK